MSTKYMPGELPPTWAIGEFKSSASPDMLVLVLATGAEISEYETHRGFVRWVARSPAAAYRLLERNETIQRADEVLADDTVNWLPLVGWEVGMPWGSNLMPMRRRVDGTGTQERQQDASCAG